MPNGPIFKVMIRHPNGRLYQKNVQALNRFHAIRHINQLYCGKIVEFSGPDGKEKLNFEKSG